MVLPMNSGAEAVESGLKVARKWGADLKGVPEGRANIIVADNNFHGRTISIVASRRTRSRAADWAVHTGIPLSAVRRRRSAGRRD